MVEIQNETLRWLNQENCLTRKPVAFRALTAGDEYKNHTNRMLTFSMRLAPYRKFYFEAKIQNGIFRLLIKKICFKKIPAAFRGLTAGDKYKKHANRT